MQLFQDIWYVIKNQWIDGMHLLFCIELLMLFQSLALAIISNLFFRNLSLLDQIINLMGVFQILVIYQMIMLVRQKVRANRLLRSMLQ